MSFHYSQALEAAFSAANYSGGEPSAPSKSTTTAGVCLCSGKTTESSRPSPSGTMCEPSMESLWRGVVDVVSGGFPCQDISAAGKGAGITGERSGLWREMARIVGEVRPRFVFVENSPLLISRGIGVVLGDFAAMGYDARWGVVSAADAIWIGGTPCLDHLRNRVWVLATLPDSQGKQGGAGLCEDGTEHNGNQPANMGATSYSERERQSGPWKHGYAVHSTAAKEREANYPEYAGWWQSEPALGRVANGVANRVDRLTAHWKWASFFSGKTRMESLSMIAAYSPRSTRATLKRSR
jgi:hypothetical protein